MESEGKRLHAQAAAAREENKLEESLQVVDSALLAYDADLDDGGFAEGLGCRAITLRILANERDSKRLLILAKHEMMAAVEIAEDTGDPSATAIPRYEYAKLQEALGEFGPAIESFSKVIETMESTPPASHDRPGVILDMRIHLAACEARNGDTSAIARLEQYVDELKKTEERPFERDVWVSGGYMKLAELTHPTDHAKANEYLTHAKEIADQNPELVVRRSQIGKLSQQLS